MKIPPYREPNACSGFVDGEIVCSHGHRQTLACAPSQCECGEWVGGIPICLMDDGDPHPAFREGSRWN